MFVFRIQNASLTEDRWLNDSLEGPRSARQSHARFGRWRRWEANFVKARSIE
jgi:hypothetical protein